MRLIQLLEVKPESLDLMVQLAGQMNTLASEEKDLERERAEAIALCERRINAAINLYGDGRLSREEYLRRVEENEREIDHWRARTTETEKLMVELTMCMQTITTLKTLWAVSNDEDRQGMARRLFEYVVYDLDKQEITDFRLKPWADEFLMMRAALYAKENNEGDYNDNPVALTGLEPVFSP